jgi:hypothetical protein
MRKLFVISLLVFAVAIIVGSMTAQPAQALRCYYKCSCSGQPMYCCLNNNGTENCKATKNISCTDVFGC